MLCSPDKFAEGVRQEQSPALRYQVPLLCNAFTSAMSRKGTFAASDQPIWLMILSLGFV